MRDKTINLGNLLLSLSEAIDLANPLIALHQQRTSYIALRIAEQAGIAGQPLRYLFIAALFHDTGALTVEEKTALHEFEEVDVGNHCVKGEILFKRIPMFDRATPIIRFHHIRWDAATPSACTDAVREAAHIVCLADYIERLVKRTGYILGQVDPLVERIRSLSGSELDPIHVDAFQRLARSESFWLDLVSPKLYSLLLHKGPLAGETIHAAALEEISTLFRDFIDFKSSFTAAHSSGVSKCAETIGDLLGVTDDERFDLRIAGNLHDLGKLIIPNAILDKNGPLTDEEYRLMRCHPYHTFHVINTVSGLSRIAAMAGHHHETLDATGYPFQRPAQELMTGERIIMVADIFTALIEDRPYRDGMALGDVLRLLDDMSARGILDPDIVGTVKRHSAMMYDTVLAVENESKEFYATRIRASA